jgi:hypothetical protein
MQTSKSTTRRDKPPNWATPEYWLQRAEEAQAMADLFDDPNARAELTKVAKGYRRMAQQAAAVRDWRTRTH